VLAAGVRQWLAGSMEILEPADFLFGQNFQELDEVTGWSEPRGTA